MRRKWWPVLILPIILMGFVVGKLHLIAYRPEVFFALGAAAVLCVGGAIYYGLDAIKRARAGEPIGD